MKAPGAAFAEDLVDFDRAAAVERITSTLRDQVTKRLHRRGVVLGLSGGIDSTVCAALAARALGPDRVLGLLMPESHSAEESTPLGQLAADHLGIPTLIEDITPVLEALGCYRRQEAAIRRVLPGYGEGWRSKIVLPSVVDSDSYRLFTLVAQSPEGESFRVRLTPTAYLELVAATNFKQRVRKMLEYHHADRLVYAVLGTPNRLEYDQGFFVKNGDGAADLKPIAHLYKTQVYALAEHLDLPRAIRDRPPTTDTYSLPQSQEEFYFSLPYGLMDRCLWAHDRGLTPAETAVGTGLSEDQVGRVFADIEAKRRATRYQHARPLLVEEGVEVDA
ncbi:NH(3)-dependent NAD(+) synthetase [Geothrix rubra]|uniref:NH(3)-dependent NAD(+) synthetase n=1 Tax=Geothrix rubra TaxID=2927977 RepID=A0ABQ5Q9B9_9BACT|nr:NAD(+) synthase [Geothrix rubra]GLH71422.1 NH(3)-dependent NAD(+) synthetase [Geothrix rubra]